MSTLALDVKVVTYETASRLIEEAMAHAVKNNWRVAVAVLDPWGAVVGSGRMDSVSPAILEIASDKAYTAAMGKTTKAFYERMSSSPDLTMGLQNRNRFCAWEGGLPLRLDGTLIGAIGVSGAAGPEDVACAEAAMTALGLTV